jgi:hypothetical protein
MAGTPIMPLNLHSECLILFFFTSFRIKGTLYKFHNSYTKTHATNGRIDRLGTILLIEYFPYYQQWPFNEVRWAKAYMQLTCQGHDLWEGNWILPAPGNPGKYVVMAPRQVNE